MNLSSNSYIKQCRHTINELQSWYSSALGQELYKEEVNAIKQLLDTCFGYNILQLGQISSENILESTRIKNKTLLNCHINNVNQDAIVCLLQRLAIKSNRVDVVLLYHCLEFDEYPHEILREVERILVPEGKLFIVSFNPYSMMGIWHYFLRIKYKFFNTYSKKITKKTHNSIKNSLPISKNWISSHRMNDWLTLLGFDSEKVSELFFRPPINNVKVLTKFKFMEKVGKRYWPYFSSIIIYKATKRVSTLTPIKQKWSLPRKVVTQVSEAKLPRNAKKEAQTNG